MKEKNFSKIIDRIKTLNLTDSVKFLTHIPNEEMVAIYSCAKLLVYPTFYEGFGLPPLEAMSCGCPVVVSKVSSLPEVCGNAAVYVDPYSPESIAGGILKVLNDKCLHDELIRKGYEQVKKFSWEKTAKNFLDVIQSLSTQCKKY